MAESLVERAAAYAQELHAGDVRKGTGVSYFEGHLEPVARLVADAGGDEVQVAAAYLHDTAEDHGGQARLDDIRARFGAEVAEIVEHLSDSLVDTDAGASKAPWHDRKRAYLARLDDHPDRSLAVAAADKLHNATSVLDDLDRIGHDLWSRFTTGDPADQRWYYESLAAALTARLPEHPTVRALVATVAELGRWLDAHPRPPAS